MLDTVIVLFSFEVSKLLLWRVVNWRKHVMNVPWLIKLNPPGICSKCNTEKSADRFGEKSRTCKDCINTQRRERYYKGRDNELAQKREKYAQNLDHYKVKNKTYHKANKEKVLLRKKLYYQQNKNKILERFNDQYKNDKDFRLKHCIRRRTREF